MLSPRTVSTLVCRVVGCPYSRPPAPWILVDGRLLYPIACRITRCFPRTMLRKVVFIAPRRKNCLIFPVMVPVTFCPFVGNPLLIVLPRIWERTPYRLLCRKTLIVVLVVSPRRLTLACWVVFLTCSQRKPVVLFLV